MTILILRPTVMDVPIFSHCAHKATRFWRSSEKLLNSKGVFLVSVKNAFVPVKRDNSVNTYSRISTVSEPVNGVSERSERSKAERCGASERSERCERTNVASDRVALSKRDRL